MGYGLGRGAGVGRSRGVGLPLGVDVTLGVDVGVAVGLAVGVAVGVTVGVGVGPDCAQYLPPVLKKWKNGLHPDDHSLPVPRRQYLIKRWRDYFVKSGRQRRHPLRSYHRRARAFG